MIFTFRFISDEEDSFVLDVNINHDQNFLQLHQTIQKALNYDTQQMASFFKSNAEWEKLDEITTVDMGADSPVKIMADTKIADLFDNKNQHILYVYDIFNERLFFGSIIRTIDAEPPINLPSISRLEGKIPEQLSIQQNIDDDLLTSFNFSDDLNVDFNDNFESLDDINPDDFENE